MATTLVSTQELAEHPEWRVFDCRHDLLKPDLGEQQYREAHIPGALFARLDHDLSSVRTERNGRHPLPYLGAFLAWIGQQGIRPGDQVVCYDAGGGVTAARLWWMLRWIGHDSVAVLDGGFAKWCAEGHPTTAAVPRFDHSTYPARSTGTGGTGSAVGALFVERNRTQVLLLDARAPERFRGEKEPIDRIAGHIPGAKNRFCNDNLTPQGVFKSADALRSEFGELLGKASPATVVNYCGSGVAACHNVLAMEIAGLRGAKLYPGSWSDWITDPQRPIGR
jgi:thiosulfate/3-mercaptopyruvate sulfurtransferase